jgi:autotransporter translocation and assembly factor TamB
MRKRRLARIAWIACLGTTVLVLAIAAALFAVSRGMGREALRAYVEAEVGRQLGVPVGLAAIEGPLFGGFSFVGFRAGDPAGPPLFVERIDVGFDPLALLAGGTWQIEALAADGLTLALTRAPDGSWSVFPADPEAAETDVVLPDLRLGALAIRGGVVLRRSEAADLVVHAELDASDLLLPFTAEAAEGVVARLWLRAADAPQPVDAAELVATLAGGRLEIERGVVAGPAGSLTVEGRAQVAGWLDPGREASGELVARVEALDLGALAGRPELAGSLSGSAGLSLRKAAGSPAGESLVELTLELADSPGAAVESARIRFGTRGGRWSLSQAEVRGTGIELLAEGAGDAAGIEKLTLSAHVPSLASLAPADPAPLAAGELQLEAEVSGAFDRPVGRASLLGQGLALRGFAFGTLRAELSGAGDGRVRVEALSLSEGSLPLELEQATEIVVGAGEVALDGLLLSSGEQRLDIAGRVGAGYLRELRVEARGLDVAALASLAGGPPGLAGLVDAELVLDGSLPTPAIDGGLTWSQPRLEGADLEAIEVHFDTAEGSLHARVSVRDAGRELLTADASLPYPPASLEPARWLESGDSSLSLHTDAFELERIAAFLPTGAGRLAGRIRADVEITGGPVPQASGIVALEAGAFELPGRRPAFTSVRGALRFEPHTKGIEIASLELATAEGVLRARGVTDGRELHDVQLEARSIDASFVGAFFDVASTGTVDLDLALDGPVSQPRADGRLTWREPGIGGVPFDVVDGVVAWDDASARATLRLRKASAEVLRIEASTPAAGGLAALGSWAAQSGARLELHGEKVELALLQLFITRRIRGLRGRADLSAEIERGAERTSVRGSIEIAEGSFEVPLLRQTFAPIEGRLTLADHALEIDELRLGTPENGAELRGKIELDDLAAKSVDLRVVLRDLQLARSAAFATDVDGAIRLAGPVAALVLDGEVELRGARAYLRDEADASLKEIRVLTSGNGGAGVDLRETAPIGASAAERAAVDLRLRVPRNSWLRGRGTELEIAGDLALRKDPLQPPAVVGRAEVVRGTYVFQNKRFEVRRGSATFDGGAAIDPILDVEAAHPVREVTVLLFLTGRASAPILRIGSEPAMSESDALAYLFLGRPADQLQSSQRSGVESAAVALAAGVASAQVGELLAGSLPIDTLDVSMDENGSLSEVKVGKYVTDRIFIRYGRTLGPEPEDEVRMEYRINPNWSVGSDVSTNDNAGADVIWSFDY